MEQDDIWTLLASLMPSNIEVNPKNDSEAVISDGNKELTVVFDEDENSYTINGKTLHFEDDFEVTNTLLIPYILQELDGERRI